MKAFLTLLSLFFVSSAYAQPLTELDSSRYFDFWVGEWVASWDEGNGVEPLGTNTITKELDGQVITEQFRITGGQNVGFKGTSISVFQPRFNRWRQAWADNQGGYYNFQGYFTGDKRIFQTTPQYGNGNVVIQRMVFYDITPTSMMWDWEISRDGGNTWNLSWRIHYTKK